jgi:hypothetical protein
MNCRRYLPGNIDDKKTVAFYYHSNASKIADEASKRFRNGEHSLLIRISQIIEKSKV